MLILKKQKKKIEYLSSDPETLALYKARERSLQKRANMISSAKDEGIQIGGTERALTIANNNDNII